MFSSCQQKATTSTVSKTWKNRRLGVQKGSLAEEQLRDHPSLNLYRFKSQPEALRALAEGYVDAVAGNYYTGIYYIQKEGLSSKIKVTGDPILYIEYTFAVKEGNASLLHIINKGIEKIQASGELEELQAKWFGRRIAWSRILNFLYTVLAGITAITLLSLALAIYLRQRIKKATKELLETNRKLHAAYEATIKAIVKALEKKKARQPFTL